MDQYMREYEELKTLPPFWGWVVLIIFSFLLITFGMIAHMFILEPDERKWDFGAAPIVPGESEYTTFEPGKNQPERQMHKLPEAYPSEKVPSDIQKAFSGDCIM